MFPPVLAFTMTPYPLSILYSPKCLEEECSEVAHGALGSGIMPLVERIATACNFESSTGLHKMPAGLNQKPTILKERAEELCLSLILR